MQTAASREPCSSCTAMQGHGHPHPLSTPHLSVPWQLWESFIDWKRNTYKACVGAGFSESHWGWYLDRSPPACRVGVKAGACMAGLAFPTCSQGAKAQILQSWLHRANLPYAVGSRQGQKTGSCCQHLFLLLWHDPAIPVQGMRCVVMNKRRRRAIMRLGGTSGAALA